MSTEASFVIVNYKKQATEKKIKSVRFTLFFVIFRQIENAKFFFWKESFYKFIFLRISFYAHNIKNVKRNSVNIYIFYIKARGIRLSYA